MRSRRSSIGLSLVAAALVAAAAAPLSCSKTAAKGAGIACQTQADCVDGDYPICDFVLRVCVAGDGGVPSDSGVGSVVDMAAMCSTSAMCKPTLPECTAGACSPCSDAGDGGVSAVCGTFFKDTPLCAAGRCVECIAAADCAAKNKACKSNRCDACATHADCTSGICDDGGKCVAADQILHVDNRGMKVADCKTNFPGADGTTAMSAWCDIADALPPRRPWILVAGSKEVYSPLSFGATVTVGLVGPGRGAATRAIIFNGNGPAISIFTPAAKNVDLLVDGFEVRSLSGDTPPLDAISCSSQTNGSKLRVRNTLVHNSSGYGVAASRCDLTLDGNDIRLNSGGGVSVATGPYSITNNFIVQNNGGKSFGVQFGSSVMGKFAFNTVAYNGALGQASGIDCGTGVTIESSIVVGNAAAPMANGTQFRNCTLVDVVTGVDSAMGIVTAPEFVDLVGDPHDFHLDGSKANTQACCIDKVAGGDGGVGRVLPQHDVDFAPRPQGPAWDIGAHEVRQP